MTKRWADNPARRSNVAEASRMLFSDGRIVPTINVKCNDFIAEWLRFPRRRELRNRTVSVPRIADGLRLAPTGKADQNSEIAIDSANNSKQPARGN